jgi:thiamine-phosphate pyrophosphorylase
MNQAQASGRRPGAVPTRVRRLYAVTPEEPDTEALATKVHDALLGGARIVQYRNKSGTSALRRAQCAALLALCRAAGASLIVNDDLDLALAAGADGLHLGRDDIPIGIARAELGDDMLLGASCYDRLELAVAARDAGADYVAFGSAFPSTTKPGAPRASSVLYREAKSRLDLPIVAIGGITLRNAPALIAAGVDAVAVISALFDAPDIASAADDFERLFDKKHP